MFKEKMQQYKEFVFLLTGYKIEFINAEQRTCPRVKLSSMFAEDEHDVLLFQKNENGLELLATDFVEHKVDDKTFQLLKTCHSIPAFISQITLDLFEHQTFM